MDRNDWDERYRTKELVWTADANQFVVAELTGRPPGRAIDVAAGEARNAVWLAEQGWDATAVDFSAVGLGKAQELAGARGVSITTEVVDVVAEALPGVSYDLVLLAYLQLPEPQRRAALAHCVAALAPGGTFFEVAHDAANLHDGYGGPQDPTVLATPEEVVAGLLAADPLLRIERAEVVERRVTTSDGERVALDHVIRAVRP
jgi:SAM-dependent methyltransferase